MAFRCDDTTLQAGTRLTHASQGKDPATDFRGYGVLGLDCLLHIAERHSKHWRELLARNEARGEREYPVATAVINACKLVNDLFHIADSHAASQEALLHPLLLSHRSFEGVHCFGANQNVCAQSRARARAQNWLRCRCASSTACGTR